MRIPGALRPAVAVALLLGLTGCAEHGDGVVPPVTDATPAAEGVVLQVENTGGFGTPSMLVGRLPVVSVYADGRVITEGPVPAIYPGPALPNLRVQQIGGEAVQDLVDRALAAGVAESDDLGTPPVADAPSTRFTLVTGSATHVREVYALWEFEEQADSGLTEAQRAARAELTDLLATLTDGGGPASESYVPDAVAAVASHWVDPDDGLTQPERIWPGPTLPGEPLGGAVDVGCATVTGQQAQAVLDAARTANAMTPWVTGNGTRWAVVFRPLLPDESGCADLTG